jgi:hypothetical protein
VTGNPFRVEALKFPHYPKAVGFTNKSGKRAGPPAGVDPVAEEERANFKLRVKTRKKKKIGVFVIVQNILGVVDLLKILKKKIKSKLGIFKGGWGPSELNIYGFRIVIKC